MKLVKFTIMSVVSCLLVVMLISLVSCQKDEFESSEQEEITGTNPEVDLLMAILFDEANAEAIITSSYFPDGTSVVRVEQMSSEPQLPMTKSYSEDNTNEWIYWGVVSGVGSAIKFNKDMQKTYGDNVYEMRAVPEIGPDGRPTGHKIMYHRAG